MEVKDKCDWCEKEKDNINKYEVRYHWSLPVQYLMICKECIDNHNERRKQ
jgi:hypothetical protein